MMTRRVTLKTKRLRMSSSMPLRLLKLNAKTRTKSWLLRKLDSELFNSLRRIYVSRKCWRSKD